jgi:hypothetical protein
VTPYRVEEVHGQIALEGFVIGKRLLLNTSMAVDNSSTNRESSNWASQPVAVSG